MRKWLFSRHRRMVLVISLLVLISIPLLGDVFYTRLGTRTLIYAILALSLDLILGYAGMVSLGHAAFFGIGAYAVAILGRYGIHSAFVVWPVAVAGCMVPALPIGAVSLRTSGTYFIMITLAEPMSRFRLHLVNTAAQAVSLVRMADHPNLRVNLDTYHMITEERDYGAAIRCCLPVLWGVHTCVNDRGVPGGGLVPWTAVFELLGEGTGCGAVDAGNVQYRPGRARLFARHFPEPVPGPGALRSGTSRFPTRLPCPKS